MYRLLQLKHWQLFLLLLIPALACSLLTITATAGTTLYLLRASPLLLLFSAGLFFSWLYTLGVSLYKKLPGTVTMHIGRFKIALLLPLVYILLLTVLLILMLSDQAPAFIYSPALVTVGMPLQLLILGSMMYALYCIAKALRAVECQGPVIFNNVAGEFMLMWCFIFGIWIIQPRINRLFAQTNKDGSNRVAGYHA